MGTYAAEEVELNLTEFFSSIEEEFTEKIIEKQITLNRQDQPPQTIIRTDSRLIHIVVSNLMSNAVKYSKNNSALTFSYELVGDKVQIIVADDGIGILIEGHAAVYFRHMGAQQPQFPQLVQQSGRDIVLLPVHFQHVGHELVLQKIRDHIPDHPLLLVHLFGDENIFRGAVSDQKLAAVQGVFFDHRIFHGKRF